MTSSALRRRRPESGESRSGVAVLVTVGVSVGVGVSVNVELISGAGEGVLIFCNSTEGFSAMETSEMLASLAVKLLIAGIGVSLGLILVVATLLVGLGVLKDTAGRVVVALALALGLGLRVATFAEIPAIVALESGPTLRSVAFAFSLANTVGIMLLLSVALSLGLMLRPLGPVWSGKLGLGERGSRWLSAGLGLGLGIVLLAGLVGIGSSFFWTIKAELWWARFDS